MFRIHLSRGILTLGQRNPQLVYSGGQIGGVFTGSFAIMVSLTSSGFASTEVKIYVDLQLKTLNYRRNGSILTPNSV